MPYQEIPHVADWSLRVWADDLPSLFAEAARGMNALSGAQPAPRADEGPESGPAARRTLSLSAPDAESLLVAFLSELVFAAEQERVTFTDFHVQISEREGGWELETEMDGAPLEAISKMIKAVTFHNLHIQQTPRGCKVEIVFDV